MKPSLFPTTSIKPSYAPTRGKGKRGKGGKCGKKVKKACFNTNTLTLVQTPLDTGVLEDSSSSASSFGSKLGFFFIPSACCPFLSWFTLMEMLMLWVGPLL